MSDAPYDFTDAALELRDLIRAGRPTHGMAAWAMRHGERLIDEYVLLDTDAGRADSLAYHVLTRLADENNRPRPFTTEDHAHVIGRAWDYNRWRGAKAFKREPKNETDA